MFSLRVLFGKICFPSRLTVYSDSLVKPLNALVMFPKMIDKALSKGLVLPCAYTLNKSGSYWLDINSEIITNNVNEIRSVPIIFLFSQDIRYTPLNVKLMQCLFRNELKSERHNKIE
jgi:hypothetical protein